MLKIWWAFAWRGALLGGLIGGVVGFMTGISIILFKLQWNVQFAASLVTQIVLLPFSILILKWVLSIEYRDFSIRLIPNSAIVRAHESITTMSDDQGESTGALQEGTDA